MNNRIKNTCILVILISFLLIVEFIPVTCIFKQVAGIYCPACGMTRAFHYIIALDFAKAFKLNILSIPLFIFIFLSIIALIYEIITNKFNYLKSILKILSNKYIVSIIFLTIFLSFIFNNLQ